MRLNARLVAWLASGLLMVCGCASTPKRDLTRLQGTWVGEELNGPKGECRMTVEGHTLKFQGASPQEWYVGTLTLVPKAHPKQAIVTIVDCPYRPYINKAALAIYNLEGDKLTLAGHEPGNDRFPTAFVHDQASQTRAFVFTRQ